MKKYIAIEWENNPIQGHVHVTNGQISRFEFAKGEGQFLLDRFVMESNGSCRLQLVIEEYSNSFVNEELKTIVTIATDTNPFSFFLGDINQACPIYIPDYGVVVTEACDSRSYTQISEQIRNKGLLTNLEKMELEREESYEAAASHTRNYACPTWLGLSRDIRIFEVNVRGMMGNTFWRSPFAGSELQWDSVQPRLHGSEVGLPENQNQPVRYQYMVGRGIGCVDGVTRRLEEGVLPILHTEIVDDDIIYHAVSFVSYEKSGLHEETLMGTHYLIADGYGFGHMLTEEQNMHREKLLEQQWKHKEETVLYYRAQAVNTAQVPRYAWFKNVIPNGGALPYQFDREHGISSYDADRVYCVAKLNGSPLHAEESAILLMPGETATYEFYLPHQPISRTRAEELILQDYESRYAECREFWKRKLARRGQMHLPEQRVDEMVKAGLLHLDLVSYGNEPEGTIVPAIGLYTAIGSESSPIIQFMDSMGWENVAQRAVSFFLDKQHENGFIQNFGGYMLETGAALWCIGEHYRYTRNEKWLIEIKPKLWKSYEYLMNWRLKNCEGDREDLGFGMLEGKTADPEDPFHSFMLNGYAYLGLSRLAEMLAKSDPERSSRIREEAENFKLDIRTAYFKSIAQSPVVPLGNGHWVPSAPPWIQYRGPLALYAEGGKWFTHGTFMGRDSLLGPMYLIFQEVIRVDEAAAEYLLHYHNELMFTRNVAFSQPYYSIHPWIHLRRGEVKPFLKAYYNGFSGLADRETYSFWEHYYQVSPHKTHEEAWFLMQTRWMLYLEEGEVLNLLPGIPSKWMENGKKIQLDNVVSYFGAFSLLVESHVDDGYISLKLQFHTDRFPNTVSVRLPHPEGKLPRETKGGHYIHALDRIEASLQSASIEVSLYF